MRAGAYASGEPSCRRSGTTSRSAWYKNGNDGGRFGVKDAKGLHGWSAKLGRLLEAGLKPELLEILDGDPHVAAIQRNTASVGGHTLDVRVVNLFTAADGKVARLDTFFSDQAAAERFWNAVL